MKFKSTIILIFLQVVFVCGQTKKNDYKAVFAEVKAATKKTKKLWNFELYSSILLVNPETREVVANEAAPELEAQNGVFIGKLPPSVNIANTATEWNGKRWAMILLPLSEKKHDRVNLLAHELFHKAQPQLGFSSRNPTNEHLDKKDGRIYLRLELEALKKAVLANKKAERNLYLGDALRFRIYRQGLFKDSGLTENELELNEGLAEFTGVIAANRPSDLLIKHFVESIDDFLKNPTFVRSFAYHTIPIYGYFLYQNNKSWNKKINDKSDLTELFRQDFSVEKSVSQEKIASIAEKYDSSKIVAEETRRETEQKQRAENYKKQFLVEPHLTLRFEKMNISFDPRNIMPLENIGTVYPNIRVTDNWGILEVTEGALLSSNWDFIVVASPFKTEGSKIVGTGWTLFLNENYTVEADKTTGNFSVRKK